MGRTVHFVLQSCIVDDIQNGIAPGIRREIGLKDNFFYNNAAECHNFRYKLKVKEDKAASVIAGFPKKLCSWVEAIESYRRMVFECRNNIQRSFIGEGPFTLAPDPQQNGCLKRQKKGENTWPKSTAMQSKMPLLSI